VPWRSVFSRDERLTMTDYLITNDPFDLGGIYDTTAGRFDPAFADHAIALSEDTSHGVKLPEVDSLWIAFDFYTPAMGPNEDGVCWQIYSQDNVVLGRVSLLNGAFRWISTSAANELLTFGVPTDQVVRIDIFVETNIGANPNQHRESVYVNGSLAVLTQINSNGGGAPARFNFGGLDYINGNNCWVSNIRISDENTVGTKFKVLPPTGQGFHDDFMGGATELGDYLSTTVAYATAGGQRTSGTLTPGAQPAGTLTRVFLSSTTRSTGPGANPSQIGLFARLGGVDYDGALQTPGAAILPIVEAYPVNPDTGLDWTWADLAGLEVGLRAVT